jgi:hypothetical protein
MTASKLRLASIGLLSVLAASTAHSAPVDRTISVDCDHGGDLNAALRRAGAGPARIRVIGTCPGQFETAGDGIEIIGRSPAETRIGVGASGPALKGTGPGQLTVRNLTILDSVWGLYAEGPGRRVFLDGCEITGNGYGVFALHGAHVDLQNTKVSSNQYQGLTAYNASELTVTGGSIHDNLRGVFLVDRSTLAMSDNEIRGNGVGLYAQSLCTVDATRTTFLDNGAHADVLDRSALSVVDSIVGPPGAGLNYSSFNTGGNSRTTIVFQSSPGIVYGTAYAVGGSNLFVQGGTLHDGVRLEDFSWAKLTDSAVEGTISCQTGSDAICAGSASAIVSGCGPVSSSCTGTPVPASEPPAFLKFVPEGGIELPRR